jgi:hypothetical protein
VYASSTRAAEDQRRRGLVLCTFARARTGQAATALQESTLDLVVFDEAVGTIPAKLATVLESAGRSVALVVGSAPLEWPGAVEVNPLTPTEFRRALGEVRIQSVYYDTSHEPPTVQEARALLRRHSPSAPWVSGSPALLHASLLNLVAKAEVADPNSPIHPVDAVPRSDQEPKLDPSEVWRLIDGLEGLAYQADTRLVALDQVLLDQDLRWVISVVARADAAYLVDHIRAQGRHVQALTGDLPSDERAAVLDDPPDIIVGTVPVIAALPRWPRGYGAIWWSPPRSDAEFEQRLARMAGYERIDVVQFVAS